MGVELVEASTVVEEASNRLRTMEGHEFQQITIHKPTSMFEAVNMVKISSKVSSLVGNLFEIDAAELLAADPVLGRLGPWIRQDPDFPDVLLNWNKEIKPGFEVKAWYPLSTEITGRFKDSQLAFANDNTYVVLFAWLPEHLLFGKPRVLKIAIVSGKSIAAARDNHYHNPPDYLVIEPRDTSARTKNLQQRNTSGYKWQSGNLDKAHEVVASWGENGQQYKPAPEYQEYLAELRSKYTYRLDTNYGKMDRVVAAGVESFKTDVLNMTIEGKKISDWIKVFRARNPENTAKALDAAFDIPGELKTTAVDSQIAPDRTENT